MIIQTFTFFCLSIAIATITLKLLFKERVTGVLILFLNVPFHEYRLNRKAFFRPFFFFLATEQPIA